MRRGIKIRDMGLFIDRIFQVFFVLAFLAIVIAGAAVCWPNYRRAQSLEIKRGETNARIDEKMREIAVLREKQRRFNSDRDFVESLARENRRVYPGELVFVFDR